MKGIGMAWRDASTSHDGVFDRSHIGVFASPILDPSREPPSPLEIQGMDQEHESEHRLPAIRENLHGTFHRDNPPVLQVKSEDIIDFETLEVGWRTERVVAFKKLSSIPNRHQIHDNGPALSGPVYVDGARPGSVLEVKFLSFQPVGWGWTSGGGQNHRIPALKGVKDEKSSLFWDIDTERQTVSNQVTFGVAETLDEASVMALEAMLDLITEKVDLTRSEALAVASSCLDLRVTQMVNPRKGIHAVLTVPLENLKPTR